MKNFNRTRIPATGISLDKSSITFDTIGQTNQITATVTPPNSTDTITWNSSNTSIATVSQTGLVTCVSLGICTITATVNGYSASCDVETLDWLCFTAEQANSVVKLNKTGSPTTVSLEISRDMNSWSDYTIGTNITLSSVGDKIYIRNKSSTVTGFNTSLSNYYYFSITGKAGASGDVTYLLSKTGTKTLQSQYCLCRLFYNCSNLTKPPKLLATTLRNYCYYQMFYNCTSLNGITKLPATTLATQCYRDMFASCSKIYLNSTKTGNYTQPYIIPREGTGTTASDALRNMFTSTGGGFTGTPTINTTYYLLNTNIIV